MSDYEQLKEAVISAWESCYSESPTRNPTTKQLCGWVKAIAQDRNCMKSNWEASEKARKKQEADATRHLEPYDWEKNYNIT